jgi:hypothetical protein
MTDLNSTTNFADPDGVAAAYLAAVKAVDASTWATFATGYRTARKAYAVADALLPEQHALMLNDHYQRDLEADLTAYAVTTAADLIEKGELIALASYMVNDAAAEALIADMARIRAVRAGGGRAAHLGGAYLAAASAASVAKDGDAENAWRESEAIWDKLAAAPILTDADAAAKVTAVAAWIDAGNAPRSDGSDRAMLREVSAYLKG